MKPSRIAKLLFANSYMRPFEQSFFFRLYGPFFKPFVQRLVRRDYMQPWTLLFLVWAVAMASLPMISVGSEFVLTAIQTTGLLPQTLMDTLQFLITGIISVLEVWGIYYITRLHLTKLFYWHRGKYPDWPTRSILFQMERYVFRPEVFALVLVTFFWLQLGNFMQANDLMALQQGDWVLQLQLWLPWLGGAVWPMVSVFFHRQILEL